LIENNGIKILFMDFEKIYHNAPEQTKLNFLEAIIMHDDKLKKEFVAYATKNESEIIPFAYEDFTRIASITQAHYQDLFEEVDTENPDWDNYKPPHSGYIPDYEAYQYASKQEFEAIVTGFVKQAIDKIIEQDPPGLMSMFAGLYEAIQNADVDDSVGSFDDVNEYLLGLFSEAMGTVVQKIRLSALSENTICTAFKIFFQYNDEEKTQDPDFLKCFEPLLIALTDKSKKADSLINIMEDAGIEKELLPELTLSLNKAMGNSAGWLQSAQQFYKNSEPVARELLQYYFETDKQAFVALARELFDANEFTWANYLKEYMSPQLDNELFVKVYLRLIDKNHDIQYYHKVKEYLTETNVKNLLQNVKWDEVFTVKILEVEQRFEEIKFLIQKDVNKWHFADMIEPILNIYPEFCFRQIENLALNTLQAERGRDIYELIARWLKLAQEIPGFEADALLLIQQLYTHKPNLPALKDEMRKAGLVK